MDFAQTLLLPLPFAAAAPIAPPPWAAPALTGSPPRGANAAASPSSNPRTQRCDASAPAPQHSNPHAHPVPMLPWSMGPRYPSSPRHRVGELPQTVAAPSRAMSSPSNPEAPRACDVGWGLDSRPCPTTEAETAVPVGGPTGGSGKESWKRRVGATGGEVVMSVALARALGCSLPRLG